MSLIFILSCLVVCACVIAGGRIGGIGLGAGGCLGVFILALFFNIKPGSPPITAMLIILTVVTAVGALQSSGGLDLMVRVAEKLLRKRPQSVTFVAPLLCAGFSCLCNIGNHSCTLLIVEGREFLMAESNNLFLIHIAGIKLFFLDIVHLKDMCTCIDASALENLTAD